MAPSPSERERIGVRVAHVFTHNPGYGGEGTEMAPSPSERERVG